MHFLHFWPKVQRKPLFGQKWVKSAGALLTRFWPKSDFLCTFWPKMVWSDLIEAKFASIRSDQICDLIRSQIGSDLIRTGQGSQFWPDLISDQIWSGTDHPDQFLIRSDQNWPRRSVLVRFGHGTRRVPLANWPSGPVCSQRAVNFDRKNSVEFFRSKFDIWSGRFLKIFQKFWKIFKMFRFSAGTKTDRRAEVRIKVYVEFFQNSTWLRNLVIADSVVALKLATERWSRKN